MWSISFYADENGNTYPASKTDQCGSTNPNSRTANSMPVEFAGNWYSSQLRFKPFKAAVKAAAEHAYSRTHPLVRLARCLEDE